MNASSSDCCSLLSLHCFMFRLFFFISQLIDSLTTHHLTMAHWICWVVQYTAGATPTALVGFYYPSDRDLMFAHVQTSAGLLFCFMTISAGLPWHQGLWPQSLILSGVSKFQTMAESFRYQSRPPKCCHSLFPGHRDPWVQGNDL